MASATTLLAVLILTGLGACATTSDRPERELALAEAGIDQAQQAGAAQHGAAELGAAREKLAAARAAADRDDMIVARRLAEKAALDAELANAMARSRKAETAVDEVQQTIEALRDEIARNQTTRGDMR
jgi:hypothetical protein